MSAIDPNSYQSSGDVNKTEQAKQQAFIQSTTSFATKDTLTTYKPSVITKVEPNQTLNPSKPQFESVANIGAVLTQFSSFASQVIPNKTATEDIHTLEQKKQAAKLFLSGNPTLSNPENEADPVNQSINNLQTYLDNIRKIEKELAAMQKKMKAAKGSAKDQDQAAINQLTQALSNSQQNLLQTTDALLNKMGVPDAKCTLQNVQKIAAGLVQSYEVNLQASKTLQHFETLSKQLLNELTEPSKYPGNPAQTEAKIIIGLALFIEMKAKLDKTNTNVAQELGLSNEQTQHLTLAINQQLYEVSEQISNLYEKVEKLNNKISQLSTDINNIGYTIAALSAVLIGVTVANFFDCGVSSGVIVALGVQIAALSVSEAGLAGAKAHDQAKESADMEKISNLQVTQGQLQAESSVLTSASSNFADSVGSVIQAIEQETQTINQALQANEAAIQSASSL